MAAKLQCEICGGKLVGKPGGIFECENCGTEYSTEWARAKIQEITGTVKVEGTVEVSGKVQVEGPVQVDSSANKEALLKRGNMALEDGEWKKAAALADQALNIDPESAEAYLLQWLAQVKKRSIDDLVSAEWESFDQRIERYASKALSNQIEASREKALAALNYAEQRVRQITPVQNRLQILEDTNFSDRRARLFALDWSGRIHTFPAEDAYWLRELETWPTVKQFVTATVSGQIWTPGQRPQRASFLFALCYNGTVRYAATPAAKFPEIDQWKDVAMLSFGAGVLVGLTKTGELLCARLNQTDNRALQFKAHNWTDVECIQIVDKNSHVVYALGRRQDGTIASTFPAGEKWWTPLPNETVPFTENGVIVIAEGTSCIPMNGALRIGLNHRLWEAKQTENTWEIKPWKLPDALVPISVADLPLRNDLRNTRWYISVVSEDGRVYTNFEDQSQFSDTGISLFSDLDQIEKHLNARLVEEQREEVEKAAAKEREALERAKRLAEQEEADRKAKIESLNKEKNTLQAELASLKGLFTGRRRKEIETRLAQIETELKNLR